MIEWERDKCFEFNIRELLDQLSKKQKAQFSLFCAVRALPLLSVKHIKQWEQDKVQDNILSIFSTIDLCAAHILNMPFNKIYIFYTGLPHLNEIARDYARYYSKKNIDEYEKNYIIATAYVIQAISFLSEVVEGFDDESTSLILNEKINKNIDEKTEVVIYSVNAAFNTIFNGINNYLAIEFQNIMRNDGYKILRNDLKEFDHDLTLYKNYWYTFQDGLSMIRLEHWVRLFANLLYFDFDFKKIDLSSRVHEYVKKIEAKDNK